MTLHRSLYNISFQSRSLEKVMDVNFFHEYPEEAVEILTLNYPELEPDELKTIIQEYFQSLELE